MALHASFFILASQGRKTKDFSTNMATYESKRKRGSSRKNFGPRTVVPPQTRCKMKYAFAGTRAVGTGYTEVVWSGTNLSDPGGGTDTRQPIGYDEMALWYTNYVNHSATIKLKVNMVDTSVTPTSTNLGGDVVIYANSSASAPSLLVSAVGQPGSKFIRFGASRCVTLIHHASNETVLGTKTHGPDSAVGLTASGPAAFNWYWHFGTATDAVYTNCSIEYLLEITYDVTFFNRKIIEMPTFQMLFSKFLKENESKWIAKTDAGVPEVKVDAKEEGSRCDNVPLESKQSDSTLLELRKDIANPILPKKLISDLDLSLLGYVKVNSSNVSLQSRTPKMST